MYSALKPEGSNPQRPEQVLKIIFGLLLVLPLLVWSVSAYQTYLAVQSDAIERTRRMADLLHEHALKVFETQELVASQVEQFLFGLSDQQIIEREASLWPRFRGISDKLEQLQDIWVLDALGHPLLVTTFAQAPRNLDLSDRAYFVVHRDKLVPPGDFYISEPLRGRADPSLVFFQLSKARIVDDVFRGVTALSVEPRYFSNFYAGVANNGFSRLLVSRVDGTALAQFPAPVSLSIGPKPNALFSAAVQTSPNQGMFIEAQADGKPDWIVAYRKLQGYPAYVQVAFDTAKSFAQWREQSVAHLYFGVPAVVGLLILIMLALRQHRREYSSLLKLQAETQHRRELEAQLHHAQRLESVGRLTGGVAHDFNNLLAVVSGSLELLRKRMLPSSEREFLLIDRALAAVERGSVLIRRLLSFARQQALEPACIDANDVVVDVADMARLSVGPHVQIEVERSGGQAWVTIDRSQFEAALLNLCVNARDAMPDGGRLQIKVDICAIAEAEATRHGLLAGPYVVIGVRDEGTGMTPEVLQKAAEPFFTTKAAGFGTGLGLSQVHGFITQSGGKVAIDSRPAMGTTVNLYLPLSAASEGRIIETSSETGPRGLPTETILVVDDDPAVRSLTAEALRNVGYDVVEVDGPASAVALLSTEKAVTAMLTDVVMPGSDGWQLADKVAQLRPALPIAFMTGFDPSADRQRPGALILRKPFSLQDLAIAMRALIDQATVLDT